MAELIDKNYLVLDNTIISYSGSDTTLLIPTRIGENRISAVGQGAFMDLEGLKHLRIPSQVRSIGVQAFRNCRNLRTVEIIGKGPAFGLFAFMGCAELQAIYFNEFPVTEQQYRGLMTESVLLEDGTRAALRFPQKLGLENLLETEELQPAAGLPRNMRRLFRAPSAEGRMPVSQEEQESFLELLRSGAAPPRQASCESFNDKNYALGRFPTLSRTVAFSFDDRKTRQTEDGLSLSICLRVGYLFWQSMTRIVCDGREYALYQRQFATPLEKVGYIRQDAEIYRNGEILQDEERRRAVYGKYLLASLL